MHRITTPVPGFSGNVAGVDFAGGVAEVDPSPGALAYFRRHGYGVEQVDEDPGDDQDADKVPARSASKADWRVYAIAHGMTEQDADAATRDELAARYHDAREGG